MKYLVVALLVVLGLLQFRLWLGGGGMREVWQLRAQMEQQRVANDALRERNRILSAEVLDLKKGTVALEERARTDLGMVGRQETFYQVVMPKGAAKASGKAVVEEPDGGVASTANARADAN